MKKIIVTFFTNSSYFKRICAVWMSSLAVVLIWFFFLQYAYFKKVTTELFEVKEDYRVCALVLRRVLHEKMKEDKSNLSIEQKKKVETENFMHPIRTEKRAFFPGNTKKIYICIRAI